MLNHPACHACDKTTPINIDNYQNGQTVRFDCSKCGELNEFDVQKPIDNAERIAATKTTVEIINDHRYAEKWLLVAALAAFLASSFFVVKYFVAGEMSPSLFTGEQWINAFIAVTLTAVITAAQMQLYASGYKTRVTAVAVAILVFFGLFSEISQSMERDDANVRQRSEESQVYKAVVQSIAAPISNNVTLPSSLQNQINSANNALTSAIGETAKYQAELDNKNANRKSSEREFTEIRADLAHAKSIEAAAQAKVNALNQQAQMLMNAQTEAGAKRTSALVDQAKELQYDENQQYAMIRLIKHFFSTSALVSSLLFSFIIIGTFEFAFHLIGAYVADHRTALKRQGRDKHGQLLTENTPPPTPPQPKMAVPKPEQQDTKNNIHNLDFGKSNYGGNAFASAGHVVSAPTFAASHSTMGNAAIKANSQTVPTLATSVTPLASPAIVRHINTHPEYQRGRILDEANQVDIEEIIQSTLPQERDVTPTAQDTAAPQERDVTQLEKNTPDAIKNAYLEICRAIHHGEIKTPTFRPCLKVLTAAKIGSNANERQAIITEVMEKCLKPENIVIDHKYRGREGKPNWAWHPQFVRKPENWNH